MDRSKASAIYHGIKSRCYNKNNVSFKDYGGKGVTMCEDWLKDKESFFIWLEYSGGSPGCEIHRENANLGYSPENCVVILSVNNRRQSKSNTSLFVRAAQEMGLSGKELAERWSVTQRQISNIGKSPSQKDWDALEGIKKEINLKKK